MTSVKTFPPAGAPHVAGLMGPLFEEIRQTFAAEDWNGLRPSHFRLLSAVPPEGITITELGERISMTKQGSGQFVASLTASGHLEARVDPADRRARVVVRSKAGDQVVKAFERRLLRIERVWAKRVGAERYAEFRDVLMELGAGF